MPGESNLAGALVKLKDRWWFVFLEDCLRTRAIQRVVQFKYIKLLRGGFSLSVLSARRAEHFFEVFFLAPSAKNFKKKYFAYPWFLKVVSPVVSPQLRVGMVKFQNSESSRFFCRFHSNFFKQYVHFLKRSFLTFLWFSDEIWYPIG